MKISLHRLELEVRKVPLGTGKNGQVFTTETSLRCLECDREWDGDRGPIPFTDQCQLRRPVVHKLDDSGNRQCKARPDGRDGSTFDWEDTTCPNCLATQV